MSEKLTVEDIGNRLFLLGAFKEDLNEMEVEEMDESELRAYEWLNGLIDSIMEETTSTPQDWTIGEGEMMRDIRQKLQENSDTKAPGAEEVQQFTKRANEREQEYSVFKKALTPSHKEKMFLYYDL